MAGIDREYRFVVNAYSPERFPMGRLAAYLLDLSNLIGQQDRVHFVRLDGGSTAVVHRIEFEAIPKVKERIRDVRNQEGPREAIDAFKAINERLASDNATGRIIESNGRNLLEFPGRKAHKELEYGPFNQPGDLVGVVIMVGGKNDPVSVHLQDGENTHICHARRDVARQLAHHLFADPIRVSGTGRWFRDHGGTWEMREFKIVQVSPLDNTPLRVALERIRSIDAAWKKQQDPIGTAVKLRTM